jgi:hypothetical protein
MAALSAMGTGSGTSVWFLFQELFTELMKSGSSFFLLVLSQWGAGVGGEKGEEG